MNLFRGVNNDQLLVPSPLGWYFPLLYFLALDGVNLKQI